jgi:glycerol-3-phosphate O-acyltransferase
VRGRELFQADSRRPARNAVRQDRASHSAQTYYRNVVTHE